MRIQLDPFRSRFNPYVNLLRAALEAQGAAVMPFGSGGLRERVDVVHLHWPEFHFRAATYPEALRRALALFSRLAILRRRGARVVWTVHNLKAHAERHPALEAFLWRWFVRRVDGFIALSPSSQDLVRALHPALRHTPAAVVPHGHYRGLLPPSPPRPEGKRRLGIRDDSFLVGFFGQVRAYKNVPDLVEAFGAWRAERSVLFVVGRADDSGIAEVIRQRARGHDNVLVRFDFVTDEECTAYVGAADLLALPYASFLNSGAAFLALSLHTPVLLPETPVTGDLEAEFGPRWVLRFRAPLAPADLERARATVGTNSGAAVVMDRHDWDRIAAHTLRFYAALAAGPRVLGRAGRRREDG